MTEPAAARPPALSRPQLYAIVFIEGFCSLGAEVLALRPLVPHLGSWFDDHCVITVLLVLVALGFAAGALRLPTPLCLGFVTATWSDAVAFAGIAGLLAAGVVLVVWMHQGAALPQPVSRGTH